MTAPMTEATYVANVVAAATAAGVTGAEALARIRSDARDQWESYINTNSGQPIGGNNDRGH
jgi:hypothetical protein